LIDPKSRQIYVAITPMPEGPAMTPTITGFKGPIALPDTARFPTETNPMDRALLGMSMMVLPTPEEWAAMGPGPAGR
jgi:hypothetical protein